MALISCPECGKKISDKANSCPNCGYPIKDEFVSDETQLEMPNLPHDLSVGSPLSNWGGDVLFKGEYINDGNIIQGLNPGKVHVWMLENGICVTNDWLYNTGLHIHKSQIIKPLQQISRSAIGPQTTNVLGRSAIGAILYGPAGAIIGALTSNRTHVQYFLIINYWDINSRKPQSLVIGGKKAKIIIFIRRFEKEF